MIKLSQKAYKLKTQDAFYVAKIIDNNQIEKIFKNIDTLKISCFVKILCNIDHHFLTPCHDHYLYLMPYLDHDDHIMPEIKIKHYYQFLANLHNQSSYNMKISQSYYDNLSDYLGHIIERREADYRQLIETYEKISMRSPDQWFFIMNYLKYFETLDKAKQFLSQFKDITKGNTSTRVCFNYQHFDYNHIYIKYGCLISIDHVNINIPVFDLFNIFQNDNFFLFDSHVLFENYLNIISLNDDEKILLKCLLNIIPNISFMKDEIQNIIDMNRLLNYIDSIGHFIEQL